MNHQAVGEALARGLAFIANAQLPSGSFTTDVSTTRRPFKTSKKTETIFTPALILGGLAGVDGATLVREKLAAWLLAQKSEHWSFNYWAQQTPERQTRAYPDDLDDTFCALIGLYRHNPALIDPTCLASAVKLLLATESEIGGPYRTWLVPKNDKDAAWLDVDIAVNANIAYFLQLTAKPTPHLVAYMERAIRSGIMRSPYYDSTYLLTYYLARGYKGPAQKQLIASLLKKSRQGNWGTPSQTALALSALHYMGHPEVSGGALDFLITHQQADGSWPVEPTWIDEIQNGKKHYAGSAALTTSFVLEALSYYAPKKTITMPQNQLGTSTEMASLGKAVYQRIQRECNMLDAPLRTQCQTMLRRIKASDSNQEISLLPYLFAQSLKQEAKISKDTLIHLCAANLYGWTAYTIYDDFLDEEGDIQLLSVANVALRQSVAHFRQALPGHVAFQKYVDAAFDRIDAANAWEVVHCRFAVSDSSIKVTKLPRYGVRTRLAERSIGHALTPMGVLAAHGIDLKSPQAQKIEKGLVHYLTARQLNDDLHDWQVDFSRGHVTYVVNAILAELNLPSGQCSISDLRKRMDQQFWHHTLQTLCTQTKQHIKMSQRFLRDSGLLQPSHIFTDLLQNLDASMDRTLKEQQKTEQFLAAYRGNSLLRK